MPRAAATEAELLEAYHRTSLRRGGITFRRALQMPCVRASLELGAAMLRHPPPPRFDARKVQAGDFEEA